MSTFIFQVEKPDFQSRCSELCAILKRIKIINFGNSVPKMSMAQRDSKPVPFEQHCCQMLKYKSSPLTVVTYSISP